MFLIQLGIEVKVSIVKAREFNEDGNAVWDIKFIEEDNFT
jgi:hypothetical protein